MAYEKKGGRGGARVGAGRKSKDVEQKMCEKLQHFEDEAIEILKSKVRQGDAACIKLYFAYLAGNPSSTINSNVSAKVSTIDLKDIISFGNDDEDDDEGDED